MRIVGAVLALLLTQIAAGEPLTSTPGNPERGRAVVVDRELGHCLLCHQINQLDESFQGSIGPDLSNVGSRLTEAVIRERVIDPTRTNPESVMPAYHRTEGLVQVGNDYVGKPILDAQQVEDVVAYLETLKQ